MTTKELILQEIEQAPEFLLEELLDFLIFIKLRRAQRTAAEAVQEEATGASHRQVNATAPIQERKPIWEIAKELMADVPPEVLAELPTDGAEQHDHYLYGSPKREL